MELGRNLSSTSVVEDTLARLLDIFVCVVESEVINTCGRTCLVVDCQETCIAGRACIHLFDIFASTVRVEIGWCIVG